MQRLYYGEDASQKISRNLLEKERLDEGWTIKYLDESNGQLWTLYHVEELGTFEDILVVFPIPTTEELIAIAFNSDSLNEVAASAVLLRILESWKKIEFREAIVNRLKKLEVDELEANEKRRFEIIIEKAELTDVLNRREVLGKHINEINKDAAFFYQTGAFCQALLSSLRPPDYWT